MNNRQWVFFSFDTFVERAEVRDLSDLVILFATMNQGRYTTRHCIVQEFLCQSCVGVPFCMIVSGHKALDVHNGVLVPSQVKH